MATMSVRVDDTLKEQTNYLAQEMGISMSSLITLWMKKFVREKKLEITIDDTFCEWYTDKEMVEVHAPAHEVVHYLDSLHA